VYEDPSSDECLNVAAEWLRICLTAHNDCPKLSHKKSPLPTRVIDVGQPDGSENPYVITTNGRRADWVALSYCWGGGFQFSLEKGFDRAL